MDHPIFTESIQRIQTLLGPTGLPLLEQEVLERLIHSSGDPALVPLLRFTPGACTSASRALAQRAVILTDTAMAAAAVAARTFANPVHSVLQWAPALAPEEQTRASLGMAAALQDHPGAVVLIGSTPTALGLLLNRVSEGDPAPALVIGIPVGFVGVADSKSRLAASGLAQIRLEGSRGGTTLAAGSLCKKSHRLRDVFWDF